MFIRQALPTSVASAKSYQHFVGSQHRQNIGPCCGSGQHKASPLYLLLSRNFEWPRDCRKCASCKFKFRKGPNWLKMDLNLRLRWFNFEFAVPSRSLGRFRTHSTSTTTEPAGAARCLNAQTGCTDWMPTLDTDCHSLCCSFKHQNHASIININYTELHSILARRSTNSLRSITETFHH